MFKTGRNLFEDGSDNEGWDVEFKPNKDYAKSYNNVKRKELLRKFKDHQESSSGSDSSSESDYSDEELLNNPEFDQEFLKALSSLKGKDPKIYDKETQFFGDVEVHKAAPESRKEKELTLKDYERKVILEKGGVFEDDDSDSRPRQRPQSPSYVEEQEKLKAEFRRVVDNDADSDEDGLGGIFKKKEEPQQEENDEAQPLKWLAGKKVEIRDEVKKSLNPLKHYWTQQDLPKPERFLRDYIMNNGYVPEGYDDYAAAEEEVVADNENLSEDESELDKQAEFEHKYNFRFEEPDKDFIKRYPRTIENTVRKKDDKRKMKREETKERKLREKQEKFKEIEMLKALKKKEIEEKIQKLKEVTGNEDLPFQDDDIEEEFDPEAHDKRMREIFNDEYYDVEEGEEKPECPDIEELKVEDWDNFDPQKDADDEAYTYEPHCEDENFNMDDDYDPNNKQNLQDELIENTRNKKNRRKRRNRFMEMIQAEKPPFNPEDERSYADYIEEYYKMDCEDIIDDTPCRFKYVETAPNDFGLTIEEILLAKTKELNQWASLKKAVQIRPEYEEKKDQRLYKLKAGNEALKRKIFASLYGPQSEEAIDDNLDKSCESKEQDSSPNDSKKKKKKKKKKVSKTNGENSDLSKNSDANAPSAHVTKDAETKKESIQQINTDNALPEIAKKGDNAVQQQIGDKTETSKNKKKASKSKNKIESEERPVNKEKVKGRKFKAKSVESSGTNISKDRLKAYGINPRKFLKKQTFENLKKQQNQGKQKNKSK